MLYYILQIDDVIQPGDQIYIINTNTWLDVAEYHSFCNQKVTANHKPVRRKIEIHKMLGD